MVYTAFLPSIEKGSQKTQLHSFEKSNLEKDPVLTKNLVVITR